MKRQIILLFASFVGLLGPNKMFIYWFLYEFINLQQTMRDTLAMAFILDAFIAVCLLSLFFYSRPIGPVKWYWFIVLSLIGGLGFGIPFFWWLNEYLAKRLPQRIEPNKL